MERKEFRFSDYIIDKKVYMENLYVDNCQIIGTLHGWIEIKNCKFENVIFNNLYEGECLNIENCEFINCTFHDTFGGFTVLLLLFGNTYINCKFETVNYYGYMDQSEMVEDKFIDCNFKNVCFEGDVTIDGIEISGGSIEHLVFEGNVLLENTFSNVIMKDILVKAAFIGNKMENVNFIDVTVRGCENENTELINCINSYEYIYEQK